MNYTDDEMEEIRKDPVRRRAYFWRVAMHARQTARRLREQRQRGLLSEDSPLTPETFDGFATAVLDNMDELIEATI